MDEGVGKGFVSPAIRQATQVGCNRLPGEFCVPLEYVEEACAKGLSGTFAFGEVCLVILAFQRLSFGRDSPVVLRFQDLARGFQWTICRYINALPGQHKRAQFALENLLKLCKHLREPNQQSVP